MKLYPKAYFKNVKEITIDFLNENNIKALILDVDNTLIDFDKKMLEGTEKWCENLKKQEIKFFILSNSNKKEKVEMVAKKLQIPYIHFGTKPLKRGFKKAAKILQEKNENIAAVGDQIFTDVIGANRCKMFSILVEPIAKKDILVTKIKRPLENYIIKKCKIIAGNNHRLLIYYAIAFNFAANLDFFLAAMFL